MERAVGKELRSLNNLILRHFENSPQRKQIETVTGTNGWIIVYLSRNRDKDIFQKDLETQFGITRSTASKVLNLMERKGLVQREKVARDARLKKIVLTQKALELSDMMNKGAAYFERKLTNGLTEDEQDTLLDYIQRMKNNLK